MRSVAFTCALVLLLASGCETAKDNAEAGWNPVDADNDGGLSCKSTGVACDGTATDAWAYRDKPCQNIGQVCRERATGDSYCPYLIDCVCGKDCTWDCAWIDCFNSPPDGGDYIPCKKSEDLRCGFCKPHWCGKDDDCNPGQICTAKVCRDSFRTCTAGKCEVESQKCVTTDGMSTCHFAACGAGGACPAGTWCFNTFCVAAIPCDGGCADDEVCLTARDECVPAPVGCDVTCNADQIRVFKDPATGTYKTCEKIECACESPADQDAGVDCGMDAGPEADAAEGDDGGQDTGPDPSSDASFVSQCDDGGYCHEPGVFSCGSLMVKPRPDQACAIDGGQTGFCCEPCWIPPDAGWVDTCTTIGGTCTPLDLACASGLHESPQACEHCSPGRCCIPDVFPPCNPGYEFPLYCNGKQVPWCVCVQPGTWQCRDHPEQDC